VLDCGTSAAPGGESAAEARAATAPGRVAVEARGPQGAATARGKGAAEARGGGTAAAPSGSAAEGRAEGAVTAPGKGAAEARGQEGALTAPGKGAAEARGQEAVTACGEGNAAARGSGAEAANTGEAVAARAAPLCALRAFAALLPVLLCVIVTWKPPRNPIPAKKVFLYFDFLFILRISGPKPIYSISVSNIFRGTSLPPTPNWGRVDHYAHFDFYYLQKR
jgi:hypothetical protein